MTEPEKTRWVRYAADCAERVLGLTGQYRPQAEAAIRAAREWVDSPTDERLRACHAAIFEVFIAPGAPPSAPYFAARSAIHVAFFDATAAANTASFAVGVASGSDGHDSERAWQADRRRFYGLEAEP